MVLFRDANTRFNGHCSRERIHRHGAYGSVILRRWMHQRLHTSVRGDQVNPTVVSEVTMTDHLTAANVSR